MVNNNKITTLKFGHNNKIDVNLKELNFSNLTNRKKFHADCTVAFTLHKNDGTKNRNRNQSLDHGIRIG
jgi:hypothetical protein